MPSESDITLKVGRKGEIFTNSDLRKRANIKEGGKVKANVVGNKLIIEAIPSIEELLRQPPVMRTTTKEVEETSEEIQKEEGIYG
jgi:bifunctional DNA-binding transcriptional regulator/antitoxin component of YhaV-PrlF toxin-antitoxin module